MMQLYVLSIICNGLSGYILFAGREGEQAEKQGFSVDNPTFHLIIGILSAVTGILKLLSPSVGVPGKTGVLIFGDLIPAAAGIVAGIVLIFGLYRHDITTATETSGSLDRLGKNLLRFRKLLGMFLFAAALVHFLFPAALFL